MATKSDAIQTLASEISAELKADILFINGGIDSPIDHELIRLVVKRKRHPDVLAILTTEGGDADAGFRMSRCLQSCYRKFTAVVPGWCKSAGTLICIGAHDLMIGDLGELGPLDVQLAKPDELGAVSSGLTIDSSFRSLQTVAFSMFEGFMLDVINKSGGRITTQTAADLSARLTTGLLSPVFEQLDPMKIGEDFRSTRIAEEYAGRLDGHAQNLSNASVDAIESLVRGYPSHGFVIDRTEAKVLFRNVQEIEGKLKDLMGLMGSNVINPRSLRKSQQPVVMYLNEEAKDHVSAAATPAPAGGARKSGGSKGAKPENGSGEPVPPASAAGDGDITIPEQRG